MEETKYSIWKYDGMEYITFENTERNMFGIKKRVRRFIPRKSIFDMNGSVIKKWTFKMFPKEVNKFNKHLLICGNKNQKEDFIDRFPNIQLYLNELNTYIKFY